jgi:carbamoyl-phosphate synthase large subunit
MINVMLTSVGGLAGDFIVRHLSTFNEYRLVGLETESRVSSCNILDTFFTTSKTTSSNFKTEIENICNKEDIDVVIPVSSHDVDFFTKNNIRSFQLKKIPKILTMEYVSHQLISDKYSAYRFCNEVGITTPKIYNVENVDFPAIYKPRKATGSKGLIYLSDLEDLKYYTRKFDDGFVSEFIDGDEYTCDSLFNHEGRCLGYLVRLRNKVYCGAATISTTANIDVSNIIKRFENSKIFRGPINFQFKIKDEEIVIFDINDRFASGGLALSIKSGFDIPRLLIDLLHGVEPIEPFHFDHSNKIKMIKFQSATYFNE